MEKEKSKLDKLKKGIGIGIVAGAIGLVNAGGTENISDFDNIKNEDSNYNSNFENSGIELEIEDDVYYTDNKIPPRKFYEKHINKMEVDESIKPILVDILIRRSSEYELTKKEIKKDIKRLVNNIDEIIVDYNEDQDWAGQHSPYEKTIRLGSSYIEYVKKIKEINNDKNYQTNDDDEYTLTLKNYKSILYEVLTHEVYHSLSYDEENYISDLDEMDWEKNHSLHEVIVEKAADRVTMNKRTSMNYEILPHDKNQTTGYEKSTFITDIIEATYGITEKEFLKSAIKGGRKNLIKTLENHANENIKETNEFMNTIQEHFNVQFDLYYRNDDYKTDKEKIKKLEKSMANIYKVSINKMNSLTQNKKIDNLKDAKEYIDNLKYNYAKLNDVMGNSLEMQNINMEEYYEEIIPQKAILENKIYNMNKIIQFKDVIDSKELILNLFNEAKENRISKENRDKLDKKIKELNKQEIAKYNNKLNSTRQFIPFENLYHLDITDCNYWETLNNEKGMFWNTSNRYRNSEVKDTYKQVDFHEPWDNEEINEKMEESYEKLYNEYKKEGNIQKSWRAIKAITRAVPNILLNKLINVYINTKEKFEGYRKKLTGKEESLMLNSEENNLKNQIKTVDEQRIEFMKKISANVNLENTSNYKKDKTEQQKSQDEGIEEER